MNFGLDVLTRDGVNEPLTSQFSTVHTILSPGQGARKSTSVIWEVEETSQWPCVVVRVGSRWFRPTHLGACSRAPEGFARHHLSLIAKT